MLELILIITSWILSILYWIELLKNVKLEKERDIETYEKNKLERKIKRLENEDAELLKIEKLREKIAELNSKVQYREILITKLRWDERNKI